ncbi:MFS transporter [Aestuariibacter sp. A3R04]|uniref:MFS transporter n=1 Tax=Aestuariibacter sp. A3R04 TaxID=2841571 RepID=UPI001C08B07A|nr:MFS transporter [Aestuariibacter sp. A3R04]MBU3023528.1 MFS transporter [Aestuariibacter sp. A3R04]
MRAHSNAIDSRSSSQGHFKHWAMVFVAMVSLLISNGMTLTALTAFDSSLLAEFSDWSRGDLKLRGLITLVVTGLLAPFVGIIIDRIGVKLLIMAGSVILAFATFAYGYITDITHMYLIHMAFGVVLLCCGLNVAVILVSNWFVKFRGTGIGIAVMGTSLGGAILAPIFGGWIADGVHWRDAFQMAAIIPSALLILATFMVKNRPSDIGALPFGVNASASAEEQNVASQGVEYRDALKTRSFWSIACIAMLTFYCLLGLQANLILHLQDVGFDIGAAAAGLSMLFTPALVGKFAFGLIADRIQGKKVLYANLFLMLLGLLWLIVADKATVLFSVAIVGFAWGGFYTLFQLNAIECFGLKASGKLLGTITVLDAFGGGLGIFITGMMFDIYGSYQPAFIVFAVLVSIALLLITQIKKHA